MDNNALLYYQRACALKFYSIKLDDICGFVIKMGRKLFFFRGGETPFNCGSSISVVSNKYCMNKVLETSGFPVPKAIAFNQETFNQEKLDTLIKNLNFPLVIKPTLGTSNGLDVLCNIENIAQLKLHLEEKFQRHRLLSIEEFHPHLTSYRVLVFYNQVIGVVQRFAARIVGDGIHSINALIVISNAHREKIKDDYSLGPIKVDTECIIRLNQLGMTLETIPNDNETIVLCYTCNDTRGGTVVSLGKKIGKENARLLCQAATALGLNLVGFDVVCEDILVPIAGSRGVIIEANHNPDITIHETPMSGIRTPVTKIMLRRLIWKHPLAYIMGFYQSGYSLYIRLSLLVVIGVACKYLIVAK